MEDYVHRAGRTGRAGNKGTCITFITPDQDKLAVDILRAMQASGAFIPDELKNMSDGESLPLPLSLLPVPAPPRCPMASADNRLPREDQIRKSKSG